MNLTAFLKIVILFIIPMLVVLTPIFIGERYGMYRIKKSPDIPHAPVGAVVGAAFALLAFMLAFTFQIAANRYDERKQLLLEEVTNIRKTYLQAGLIQEPIRSETRKLIVEYIDIRVQLANDQSKLDLVMKRSPQILDSFWNSAEALAKQDRSSEIYALFTTTVNELIDNYNQRITWSLEYRIPPAILWILFLIAFLTMLSLGYEFGISGKRNFSISILLAVVFSMVMFLILALDRPETGLVRLNQKPLYTLQKQINEKALNDISQKTESVPLK
jgi:hypothetical protein